MTALDDIVQLDLNKVRSRFPQLARDTAFLDNAGGSCLPEDVLDAMTSFMRTSFVLSSKRPLDPHPMRSVARSTTHIQPHSNHLPSGCRIRPIAWCSEWSTGEACGLQHT